jgi:hypothetical protein
MKKRVDAGYLSIGEILFGTACALGADPVKLFRDFVAGKSPKVAMAGS